MRPVGCPWAAEATEVRMADEGKHRATSLSSTFIFNVAQQQGLQHAVPPWSFPGPFDLGAFWALTSCLRGLTGISRAAPGLGEAPGMCAPSVEGCWHAPLEGAQLRSGLLTKRSPSVPSLGLLVH